MSERIYKAAIFDIGGVVLRSPFIAIAEYERQHGIPDNYINTSIVARGAQGAWQRFERGELELFAFYDAFSRDLSDTVNGNAWYKAYCKKKGIGRLKMSILGWFERFLMISGKTRMSQVTGPFEREWTRSGPQSQISISAAVGKHKVIALTNNYSQNSVPQSERAFLGWEEGATTEDLRSLFDDFCDSSALGTRKPEPKFYLIACERNGIKPHEAIFLDDIGLNLKAAKELGMDTIHVPIGGTFNAVKQLEAKLGLDLTGKPHASTAKM
ncbi:hypothetical protein VNI00_005870 [Paramarasmius palmivorus]|uniref:Epoxide hydrolase n=1 Tax=Paramarasmius palmivorus TaxID=297713 RepID=A0AAW0DEX9_9AGAR